nr:RpiB/LacA/LacB family sugar-phosphate isomerase [Maliibacterium massiliense]
METIDRMGVRPLENLVFTGPVALGADGAGSELKGRIMDYFDMYNVPYINYGMDEVAPGDYPVYAQQVAEAVRSGQAQCGIVFCGTGIGISMAAGKVPGVYAARCDCMEQVRIARQTLDVNVLSMGGRVTGLGLAAEMVWSFMTTAYDASTGGRALLEQAEAKHLK